MDPDDYSQIYTGNIMDPDHYMQFDLHRKHYGS